MGPCEAVANIFGYFAGRAPIDIAGTTEQYNNDSNY
jgi:hypothetical protein